MQERFFIVGCQRSGTTLTRLVLECHSRVYCFDELLGYAVLAGATIEIPVGKSSIGFKIPRWTEQLLEEELWDEGLAERTQNFYRGEKIVFLLRDVRDTIVSMMKLPGPKHRWLDTYPSEIIAAKTRSSKLFREKFEDDLRNVATASDSAVAMGALYWKYKTNALFDYAEAGLPVFALQYKDLVENSAVVLPQVCEFLGIQWEPGLLDHPRFSHGETFPNGTTLGNTDPLRPIHSSSMEQWKEYLTREQLADIDQIAGAFRKRVDGFATKPL